MTERCLTCGSGDPAKRKHASEKGTDAFMRDGKLSGFCPDSFHSKPTDEDGLESKAAWRDLVSRDEEGNEIANFDEDGLSERPAGTSLGSDRPVSPPPLAESVEGEAGGEAWTFRIRPEDSKHGYFEVEIDGPHDDLSQMIQPPWGEPMVPESSLNAALARAEEAERAVEVATADLSRFDAELPLTTQVALDRAEEAERERDKLEALATGQAATIERVRKALEHGSQDG